MVCYLALCIKNHKGNDLTLKLFSRNTCLGKRNAQKAVPGLWNGEDTLPAFHCFRKLHARTPETSNSTERKVLCFSLPASHVTIHLSITPFPVKKGKQNGIILVLGTLKVERECLGWNRFQNVGQAGFDLCPYLKMAVDFQELRLQMWTATSAFRCFGCRTQGFMHAGQAFCQLGYNPS